MASHHSEMNTLRSEVAKASEEIANVISRHYDATPLRLAFGPPELQIGAHRNILRAGPGPRPEQVQYSVVQRVLPDEEMRCA